MLPPFEHGDEFEQSDTDNFLVLHRFQPKLDHIYKFCRYFPIKTWDQIVGHRHEYFAWAPARWQYDFGDNRYRTFRNLWT